MSKKRKVEKIKDIEIGNYYYIPIIFKAKYQLVLKLAIIYFNLCIAGQGYIFLIYKPIYKMNLTNERFFLAFILLLFVTFVLYLDIDFIHSSILHRQYVELNFKGIIVKKLFTKKIIMYSEVYTIDLYTYKMAEIIRFICEKDLDSGLNVFSIFLGRGVGLSCVKINRRKYTNIDISRLMSTVRKNIKTNC